MGERTSYTAGTFSWTDLATTDQEGAKSFYSQLFGWQSEDLPVGEGAYYSMQQVDGKNVAAISQQPPSMAEAGAPAAWNSYVTVASVDDAAARAGELGANLVAPPFDVMEAGRMAVLQDPQGAFLMLWEPRDNIGAQLVNAPGALCWNELQSPDLDASKGFYGDLFAWTYEPFGEGEPPYFVIQNEGRGNGGITALRPPAPPHWLVYFAVDSLDAAIGKVRELGGQVYADAVDIGVAKIAVVADPQGAVFALYDGQLED